MLSFARGDISLQPPFRQGRYDKFLDGSIWELTSRDMRSLCPKRKGAPGRQKRKSWSLRRSLRFRARTRGLDLCVSRLCDGALVVQARRRP